jgi:dTDP-4-amino-4,6-dideoxygalactose transaminase
LDFDTEEKEAVLRVLDSRWLTMGEVTQRFEQAFAEYIGAPHAIALTNATAGLQLAVRAIGLQPGDEIILPSLSFVATSNAVLYEGGVPVFCDVAGDHDLCIDPSAIEGVITPKTKAIIVMHYGGYMCDMPAIFEIAGRHGLTVIEDAAHAPGASMQGRNAGTWGKIAVFSFFSNKNLAAGEGGMITTHDGELAERIRLMRSHGMTSLTWDRHQGHAYSYDVVDLGYNYRTDEIRSALGHAQLAKLDRNNARRREISASLRARLSQVVGISMPFAEPRGLSAAHLFPIVLPAGLSRKGFMDAMRELGVQTSIHYPPIHQFTYYRNILPSTDLPNTESLAAREVTLPLFPTMREDQISLVVEAVQESLALSLEAAYRGTEA